MQAPHEIISDLQKQGVMLRVNDGKVYGPRSMTAKQKETVKENKAGLLIALTYTCSTCNQAVRMYDRGSYWSLECATDPTHYSELISKQLGKGLGYVAKHDEGCPCKADPVLGW